MKSRLFTINLTDAGRGLFLAVATASGTALLQILNSGALPDKTSLKPIGIAGAAAGLSYVMKNFFTNSKDKMFQAEPGQEDKNAKS